EAGVRQLERELGKILRKVATKIVAEELSPPVVVDLDLVREALGRQRFFQEAAERTALPGVATGLSVTGTGGDVLFIEATAMKGKEPLVLTGRSEERRVGKGCRARQTSGGARTRCA